VHTNFPRKQPWSSRAASWGTQNLAKSREYINVYN
jgi:hypothetical protein